MSTNSSKDILKQLSQLLNSANKLIPETKDKAALENVRVELLGRKSTLNEILKGIKDLDAEGKKEVGKEANKIKLELEKSLANHTEKLQKEALKDIDNREKIDVTLPGEKPTVGHLHPVTQMAYRAEEIFQKMGFEIYYPYEVDDDYHHFESLNFPLGHPARDNWDTFLTKDGQITIAHTSSMQNRVLKSKQPPIRAIVPGRCFRNEATDARHEHTFYQFEGIYVDKGITLTDMLGTLKEFFSKFYEKDIGVKFTPDFFPFVEPGGMMSLTCILCDGKGCNVCKGTGWLEVLGCGMIHPEVLRMAGIDSNTYSGFAWGFGLERLIMLKYNIEDIRHFYSGNLDFIKQF